MDQSPLNYSQTRANYCEKLGTAISSYPTIVQLFHQSEVNEVVPDLCDHFRKEESERLFGFFGILTLSVGEPIDVLMAQWKSVESQGHEDMSIGNNFRE